MIHFHRLQFSCVAFLSCLLVAVPAFAQSAEELKSVLANGSARSTAIEAGRKVASFCANCHGDNGNSKQSDVPNLAEQNPVYLLNQVNKFYTGERKDQWMEPTIRLLSETERLNLVAFYTAQHAVPASVGPGDATGRNIFQRICSRCHGMRARGGERFPRLAGQQRTYIVASLTRYRDRTGTRMDPEMLAMTAGLTDAQIQALASYLSAMR
jgi:cytochrome c553